MRILIDLSMLCHPYCGLGQVAMNYGRWYGVHASEALSGHEVTLLVPRSFVGHFGTQVRYLVARDCYRWLPGLMPRFDVWHSIHQLAPFRPAGGATRRVLTIHDVNFMYEKSPAKQRKYLHRLQRECDRASEICFISRFAQQETMRFVELHDKPTHIIPNGVEELTQGLQESPQGIDSSRPFFLSLGVVKAKKNLQTLIPMMSLFPQYDLLIAGDDSDPYAERLRQESAGNSCVRFLGTVTDEQRRWLYAHCSALLFPSLCEGFGLPVVEAMQWGKPVFCAWATALPETGGEHAFYFDDFTAEAMATVVREGLSQFTPGRQDAEQAYAATFGYDRHLECYRKILTNDERQ